MHTSIFIYIYIFRCVYIYIYRLVFIYVYIFVCIRVSPEIFVVSNVRLFPAKALEMGSSINTALEVSTPGWWANIVLVVSW